MPQSGEPFRRCHHVVLVLLVVAVCAIILTRIWQGWRPASHAETGDRITLRLDPNTATAQELAAIPGVGPALAARIVAYREQQRANGRTPAFTNLADLDAVAGVGPATLDEIAPYLHLSGAKP